MISRFSDKILIYTNDTSAVTRVLLKNHADFPDIHFQAKTFFSAGLIF
jgi:hypothetical protein